MDFKGLSDPVVIFNKPEKKPGIFQRIKPPTTDLFKNKASLMLRNKKFLGGALTILLLFAVGLGVYLSQKPTQLTPQANEGKAEISIKPPTQTVALNQEFTSDVFIDTKDLTVSGVDTKIVFDPEKLQLLEVTLGEFIPNFLSQPQNSASSTTFTIADMTGRKGTGVMARLKFRALSLTGDTPAKVEFDQSLTEVAATESAGENAASGFFSSEITILATVSASPSPTASSSALPSSSPSSSPSASPNNNVTPGAQGDANSDGLVDYQDLSIFFSKWSPAADIAAFFNLDFNNDKRINSLDYSLFKQLLVNFGVIRG